MSIARLFHRRFWQAALICISIFCLADPVPAVQAQSTGSWHQVGPSVYLTGNTSSDPMDSSNVIHSMVVNYGNLVAGTTDGVYVLNKNAWYLVGKSQYFNTGTLLSAGGGLFATFRGLGVAVLQKNAWYQVGQSRKMNAAPLAVVGNTLYAGTDKGVFVLLAKGVWKAVGRLSSASFLANIGGQLYADGTGPLSKGSNDLYVYRKDVWQAVGSLGSYFNPLDVSALVHYGDTLYAATDNGVYAYKTGPRTPATKGTWNEAGLDGLAVNTLLVMKGVLYAGTTGNLEEGGVYAFHHGLWDQAGPSPDLKGGADASAEVHALVNLRGVMYAGTNWGVYAFSGQ